MSPSLRELFRFRKPSRLQWMGLVVTMPLIMALFVWSLRDFQFAAFWPRVINASLPWLLMSICCLVAGQLLRVWRWQRVLMRDVKPKTTAVAKAIMDGQLINWLSPIRLGDVWRVWRLSNTSDRNVLWVVISIVLEKSADSFVLGLFAMILVVAPMLVQFQQSENSPIYGLITRLLAVGLGCLLLVGAALALRPRTWISRLQSRLPQAWLEKISPDRLQVPPAAGAKLRNPAFWLELVVGTLAIWLFGLATNVALALALGIPLSFGQHVLLLLAFQVGLVLSTVPGNIGIFPLVASGIFRLLGYGLDDGIVFGSLLYVIVNGGNVVLWFGYRFWGYVANRTLNLPQAARISVNGVPVDCVTIASLLARADAAIRNNEHLTVMYANAHAVNMARHNPEFMRALNSANLVFCDGFGVYWAARMLGAPLPQRLTPPDWIGDFAVQCASNNTSIYLLGSQPGVAERAAQKIRSDFTPTLQTVCHGGFFDTSGAANDAIIEDINASGASVLLVGMGPPIQEQWLERNRMRLTNIYVCISVGALFDYLSGNVRRGPPWMTNHGLEWLARLLVEPGRLWQRYLLGNPVFVWHVLRQKLSRSL